MDIILREEYWIKFCIKLITVISHDIYYSNYKHMGGACGIHGKCDKCVLNFIGNPEGTRPVSKRSKRWEDNIKTDDIRSRTVE
jgi:hypothetical protein